MRTAATQGATVHALRLSDALTRILKGACVAKASDIHLRADQAPIVRLAGELRPFEHPPLSRQFIEESRDALGVAALIPRERLARPQVDFSCVVPDVGRFRVHAYHQAGGAALVLRAIPNPIPDLGALRLPPVVKRLAALDRGLVLVTGATGNGKSTTIAALLELVNQELFRHIVTLEDPVEFIFEEKRSTFSQREVGRDVDDAHQGLLGALREDPDWVFVGEIRTLDELDVALSAAEAGHVVISTMHAQDTTRAIQRMVNLYPEGHRDSARQRLADSLAGIVSQRLLLRRGTRERILATEVLLRTPTVQDCIRDPARIRGLGGALEAGTGEYGTHTFDQQILALFSAGLIAEDTARAAASSPHDVMRAMKMSGRWPR